MEDLESAALVLHSLGVVFHILPGDHCCCHSGGGYGYLRSKLGPISLHLLSAADIHTGNDAHMDHDDWTRIHDHTLDVFVRLGVPLLLQCVHLSSHHLACRDETSTAEIKRTVGTDETSKVLQKNPNSHCHSQRVQSGFHDWLPGCHGNYANFVFVLHTQILRTTFYFRVLDQPRICSGCFRCDVYPFTA